VYTVVELEHAKSPPEALRRIVREFLEGIDVAATIVVLKTGPGNASTLSQAIDDAGWPEAVGSIAGENTVFVVVRSVKDARRLERRLQELLE
jgi:transcriptional regulator of arginine metabolism